MTDRPKIEIDEQSIPLGLEQYEREKLVALLMDGTKDVWLAWHLPDGFAWCVVAHEEDAFALEEWYTFRMIHYMESYSVVPTTLEEQLAEIRDSRCKTVQGRAIKGIYFPISGEMLPI